MAAHFAPSRPEFLLLLAAALLVGCENRSLPKNSSAPAVGSALEKSALEKSVLETTVDSAAENATADRAAENATDSPAEPTGADATDAAKVVAKVVADDVAIGPAAVEVDELVSVDDELAGADGAPRDADAASSKHVDPPATHRQTAIIRAATETGSELQSFVVAPNGNIMALVQVGLPIEQEVVEEEIETGGQSLLSRLFGSKPAAKPVAKPAVKPVAPACEVRSFSPDGKQLEAWPVKFMAQTMCLGPSGCLLLAGSGRLGRYSLAGEELATADSPQSALIEKDRDALRAAAEAQMEENNANLKQMIVAFKEQRDAIAAEIKKSGDKSRESELAAYDAQIAQVVPERQDIDAIMGQITKRIKRINAITASDKEVFITCGQTKGYGYSVWRMDLAFADPKCIITGLSGCCGQMDVCCASGELWVAENSRHKVVRYNREGKRLSAFGKTDRDGVGERFGGCCNPMNLCFDKAGELFVSESNGHVKHFTPKGKFVELAGVAEVRPGCKNSAVKISPDGERIYYIDVNNSQIIVLDRSEQTAAVSN